MNENLLTLLCETITYFNQMCIKGEVKKEKNNNFIPEKNSDDNPTMSSFSVQL